MASSYLIDDINITQSPPPPPPPLAPSLAWGADFDFEPHPTKRYATPPSYTERYTAPISSVSSATERTIEAPAHRHAAMLAARMAGT